MGGPPTNDTQAAGQDAADLGEAAASEGNKPGTTTDEAESRVQQAVDAANAVAEETGGMGEPGRPMNRRSPFYIGLTGAAGVAVTYGLVELFARSRSILIIIGLGLFIAVGLDPVASWLTRRGMPRWAAVLVVLAGLVGIIGIFLAIAIPPLTSQTTALAKQVPTYLHQLQNLADSELGGLQPEVPDPAEADEPAHQPGLLRYRRGARRWRAGHQHLLVGPGRACAYRLFPGRAAQHQAVRLPSGPAFPPGPG